MSGLTWDILFQDAKDVSGFIAVGLVLTGLKHCYTQLTSCKKASSQRSIELFRRTGLYALEHSSAAMSLSHPELASVSDRLSCRCARFVVYLFRSKGVHAVHMLWFCRSRVMHAVFAELALHALQRAAGSASASSSVAPSGGLNLPWYCLAPPGGLFPMGHTLVYTRLLSLVPIEEGRGGQTCPTAAPAGS